jgi:SAM-dependent methyltransferase
MPSYEVFGRFYDDVLGDRADHAAYLLSLIEQNHPAARSVLELACGTGSILERLAPSYDVTGVDLSPRMLAAARRKVPEARLALADMRSVRLDARFDVVLCVYDSINHLRSFRDLGRVFVRVRDHLEPDGVFVFDINTERALAELAARPPLVSRFGDGHLLVIDVRAGPRGSALWNLSVFEPAPARCIASTRRRSRNDRSRPTGSVRRSLVVSGASPFTMRSELGPAAVRIDSTSSAALECAPFALNWREWRPSPSGFSAARSRTRTPVRSASACSRTDTRSAPPTPRSRCSTPAA